MLGDNDMYSHHDSPERPATKPADDGAGPAVLTYAGSTGAGAAEEGGGHRHWNAKVLTTPERPAPQRQPVSPARMALEDVLKRQREARGETETVDDIVPDLPLAQR